jgi:hypothetical protein
MPQEISQTETGEVFLSPFDLLEGTSASARAITAEPSLNSWERGCAIPIREALIWWHGAHFWLFVRHVSSNFRPGRPAALRRRWRSSQPLAFAASARAAWRTRSADSPVVAVGNPKSVQRLKRQSRTVRPRASRSLLAPTGLPLEAGFFTSDVRWKAVDRPPLPRRLCTRPCRTNTATRPSYSEQTACCKRSCRWF